MVRGGGSDNGGFGEKVGKKGGGMVPDVQMVGRLGGQLYQGEEEKERLRERNQRE